jgi:hypothetical protein
LGIAVAVIGIVVLKFSGAMPEPSAASATPDMTSAEFRGSLVSTGALVLSPMLMVFGWLLRQKR